ncbi:thioredoxin family protein [Cognatilysobacter lacus]|uniref:Thioredoxin family protein n=1 Tax=Cognatilysobacter lacus TaxID=1643323 RepID=A0A5D8Z9W1_9GAMM|nr:thioredoxin family protein [Lysobacter lacus]TZF91430.1 thioredoxin family protein [Lysobacter lacus]
MAMSRAYVPHEPARETIDAMPGALLLEFGAPWCPHCLAAEPLLDHALARRDGVTHLRIEDGRGRRLGRSFAVKLWPTFVLLQDGVERARSVRPRSLREIEALFDSAEA